MLHLDIPTLAELRALSEARAEASVSIYLPTTPVTQAAQADRVAFRNLAREATGQLEGRFDKRRLAELVEHLDDLADDDDFWAVQARSLAVLADPAGLRAYRLPNRLTAMVQVSDRFHLKPLLRAVTFPHEAFLLVLSHDGARLMEIAADMPPVDVKVPGMPTDAPSAAGKASIAGRSASGRLHSDEGRKLRLRQYARKVDAALRPVLAGRETPLMIAANQPLDQMFASVCSYPFLDAVTLPSVNEKSSEEELAAAVTARLDEGHADVLADLRDRYAEAKASGRATSDYAQAARAATMGAVAVLAVDMDAVTPGTVDEDGRVTFAETGDPGAYGVGDEIASRALASGARVLSARAADLPEGKTLVAILRWAV